MPPANMSCFVFVEPHGLGGKKSRNQELQDSKARAHAAKASYPRRTRHGEALERTQRRRSSLKSVQIPDSEEDPDSSSCYSAASSPSTTTSASSRPSATCVSSPESITRYSRRLPSPTSLLSQSTIDPFEASDFGSAPPNLYRVLDYVYECIWPTCVPKSKQGSPQPIQLAWRRIGMEHPMVLHSQLSCVAEVARVLDGQSDRNTLKSTAIAGLSHRGIGFKLVGDAIRTLNGEPPDELILALWSLGRTGGLNELELQESHPRSPLADAQYMRLWGSMKLVPEHFQAMYALVDLKGGLDSLKIPGLAEFIQVADTHSATRTGLRPRYPWMPPSSPILADDNSVVDPETTALRTTLGTGFSFLQDVLGEDLMQALKLCYKVTVAVDQHKRCAHLAPEFTDIVIARNETQHRLCSLLPLDSDFPSLEETVQECCRIATMIYSDMVIFPTPPSSGVKPRLAMELQKALLQWQSQESDEAYTDVILWAFLMGAIASSFTSIRSWYVAQLRVRVAQKGIKPEPFRTLMSTFLWWEPVFQEPALRLCDEVHELDTT